MYYFLVIEGNQVIIRESLVAMREIARFPMRQRLAAAICVDALNKKFKDLSNNPE